MMLELFSRLLITYHPCRRFFSLKVALLSAPSAPFFCLRLSLLTPGAPEPVLPGKAAAVQPAGDGQNSGPENIDASPYPLSC